MKVNFSGELRSVVKGKEFTRRTGEQDYSVNMTVEIDGRSYYLPCIKEVLKAWEDGIVKKGSQCTFEADYRPTWKFNQFEVLGFSVVR